MILMCTKEHLFRTGEVSVHLSKCRVHSPNHIYGALCTTEVVTHLSFKGSSVTTFDVDLALHA